MIKNCFLFILIACSFSSKGQSSRIADFFVRPTGTNEVLVVWVTEAGATCPNLHIERGSDSSNFSKVYTYPSVCGNADERITYTWVDPEPIDFSINYYRVNVDDVEFTFSKNVDFQSNLRDNNAIIFPNPNAGHISLEHRNQNNQEYELSIFNLNGDLFFTQKNLEGKKFSLEVPNWESGYYIALIRYQDKSTETINFSILK